MHFAGKTVGIEEAWAKSAGVAHWDAPDADINGTRQKKEKKNTRRKNPPNVSMMTGH